MKRILAALWVLCIATGIASAEIGDDGLHKAPWMRDTFKDTSEDLAEATAVGKRLMLIVEQRGCIYCTKMHEEVFPDPEIEALIEDNFFVVQLNLFGDVEVTDFDGETLSEKNMAMKWGLLFTPTILFFPEDVAAGTPAHEAAAVTMPGAFGRGTTLDLLTWVLEEGYNSQENFQKYHARKIEERRN